MPAKKALLIGGCPQCGCDFDDAKEKCPACGFESNDQTELVACCPRCGHVFSNAEEKCPACGFASICSTELIWSQFEEWLTAARNHPQNGDLQQKLQNVYAVIRNNYCYPSPHYSSEIAALREAKERSEWAQQNPYTPRCPTCGSPRIVRDRRIEPFTKTLEFLCTNCGYRW